MLNPTQCQSRELRLQAVLVSYLEAVERGQLPALADLQARYPEFAAELADLAANVASLDRLAAPLRQVVESAQAEAAARRTVGRDSAGAESALGMEALPEVPGYRLLEVLGQGGMGIVYKAEQAIPRRTVAIKMIRSDAGVDELVLTRFQMEARAIARMEHANIVQIHEVGTFDGRPYFVLEYCGNGNLAGKIRGLPLPPERAAWITEQLARAVDAAHQQGIVHRDLKPANVLVSDAGVLKITDFGLAKRLNDSTDPTQPGSILGTPSYMAPEQASGRNQDVGPLSDVYALGAILYECLTGHPPFRGDSVSKTLDQVRNDPPVPLRTLQRHTPLDLEAICLKCLEKDPAQRYPSARALAEDLDRYMTSRPVRARDHKDEGEEVAPRRWRRRAVLIFALLCIPLVVWTAKEYLRLFRHKDDPIASPVPRQREREKPKVSPAPGPVSRPTTSPAEPAEPDLVVYRRRAPAVSGITLRADGLTAENHALAIILDCSGSMMRGKTYSKLAAMFGDGAAEKFLNQYDEKTECNYHDATGALRQVLAELPDGVHISIYVYSHEGSKEASHFLEMMRGSSAWSERELKATMQHLERLKPYHDTPIVHSMLRVRDEGFPAGFKGFKSMIVLTDGEDTEFAKDAELSGKYKTIPNLIKEEFKDFDGTINVVGFRVTNDEEKNFRAQFEEPIKKLRMPGKFYTTADAAVLADRLKRTVNPTLYFTIETKEGQPVKGMPEDGWVISRNDQPPQWIALEPGSYVVRVEAIRTYQQGFTLGNGDFMIASLKEEASKDKIHFERVLLGDNAGARSSPAMHGWQLAALHQRKAGAVLEILVALEKRSRGPGPLSTVRPSMVWFEAAPQGQNEPISLSVTEVTGYPAPVWRLTAVPQPTQRGPARPVVRVWCSSEDPARVATLMKRRDGTDLASAFKEKLPIVGLVDHTVSIEDIRCQKRTVEVEPGAFREVPCLVVRFAFPKDSPVQVLPDGVEFQGSEHRYYRKASKGSAIFWSLNEDAAAKLRALQLISIEQYKLRPQTSRVEVQAGEPSGAGEEPRMVNLRRE